MDCDAKDDFCSSRARICCWICWARCCCCRCWRRKTSACCCCSRCACKAVPWDHEAPRASGRACETCGEGTREGARMCTWSAVLCSPNFARTSFPAPPAIEWSKAVAIACASKRVLGEGTMPTGMRFPLSRGEVPECDVKSTDIGGRSRTARSSATCCLSISTTVLEAASLLLPKLTKPPDGLSALRSTARDSLSSASSKERSASLPGFTDRFFLGGSIDNQQR
jgi:hypothetical protein